MKPSVIGLGRMGANIVRRLQRHGHACVVYDVKEEAVQQLVSQGGTGATALYARFRSRQDHTFDERPLSAMRFKFGGQVEQRAGK